MTYLANFFEHSEQFSAIAGVTILWLALISIGSFIGGSKRIWQATPFYGWAFASLVLTLGGVITDIPFSFMSMAIAVAAIPAGIIVYHREGALVPPELFKIILLSLPLLFLTSAMASSQWDEFSHWLLTPRLLLELDLFPTSEDNYRGGSFPAYPYAWTFITYWVSLISGRLVENAGAMSNVFLLLICGALFVRLIQDGLGQNAKRSDASWTLCALGVLAAIPFNFTFSQKVALTAYADTSSAVAVAFSGIIGWKMLNALAEQKANDAIRLSWGVGMVFMVLVNLKQATLILFILVAISIFIVGLIDPKIKFRDLLRIVPGLIIPPLVIYISWRYYVALELSGQEFVIRPFSGWFIKELPEIIWRMLVILSKKGLYLALLIVVTIFAIRGLFRMKTPLDRLAVITGGVMLGYNAFLLFSYVAVFGKYEALRAASMWRYNMHLGLLGTGFYVYSLSLFWKGSKRHEWKRKIPVWAPVVLLLAAQLAFAEKFRFDKVQPVPHYRYVSKDLREILFTPDKLIIVDLKGTGESGTIAGYELKGRGIVKGVTSVYHSHTVSSLTNMVSDASISHLLVHSFSSDFVEALGMKLEENGSYLLKRDKQGIWSVLKKWLYPEGFRQK
jgi:hypothetical protein